MSDNENNSNSEHESVEQYLKNKTIPSISLPNQQGSLLRLDRVDTFRIILFFFPMTGRPDRPLPNNWNNIPDAKGSTKQACLFRDNYDNIITLNAVPIGICSQTVDDNKEMTNRLKVPYDILSDERFELKTSLKLPVFSIENKDYFKHLILIIEKKIIKKVFYPIYLEDKHLEGVLKWLQEN